MIQNYLTFTLEKTHFAVEISSVLEVLNFTTPTSIPCSDPYIEGLIYSREQGINVVNLRKRFDLSARPIDKKTKVIVVEVVNPKIENDKNITLYGLVADSVQDVIQIDAETITSAGPANIPAEFITAEFVNEGQTFFILNFYKLFEKQIKESMIRQGMINEDGTPVEPPAQNDSPADDVQL